MSAARRVASTILGSALRCVPQTSQEWAQAMLAELDYIQSDWAALLWALGSTTAIFRHGIREWRAGIRQQSGRKEKSMLNGKENRTMGIVIGAVVAGLLVVFAFGAVELLFHLFPKWDLGPMPWWVAVIVIPEITFIVAIMALWRKRRPMAMGILLTAVILATHFAVHIANHFH